VAGNLGAGPAQAAAGAFEKAIRDGVDSAGLEGLRSRLQDALARLASALGPVLAEAGSEPASASAPPAGVAPADPAVLRPVVERWSRLLAESDASSLDDLEREGNELEALFDDTRAFAAFAEQVRAYDFDGGLATLRKAAARKGIEG
jgi:hypothetical protein